MSDASFKEKWLDMDPKFRYAMIGIVVLGVVLMIIKSAKESSTPPPPVDSIAQTTLEPAKTAGPKMRREVLPTNNRNLGLEDLMVKLTQQADRLDKIERGVLNRNGEGVDINGRYRQPAPAPAPEPTPKTEEPSKGLDLNEKLPPPVKFDSPDKDITLEPSAPAAPKKPSRPQMKTWPSELSQVSDVELPPNPVLVVNSALQAVMLSGVNARPAGGSGANGGITSANTVGAPFVSRVKGEAILPNGWRMSDLGDCSLSGTAVAVLSTERAYAIADVISCISPEGEVWEAPIKAYGLDADGTLGLAGRVVSKQGSLLLQSALTGIASGLAAALTPVQTAQLNTNPGSTPTTQNPDPRFIAQSALGNGLNQAASQLSKFYLDYAKEIFPVVEVGANTRITWIVKETVELRKVKQPKGK